MSESSFAVPSASDATLSRTTSFLERVFPPPRDFNIRLWDGSVLPGEESRFVLAIRSPGSLRRMFRPPVELSLGESYLRRDFDVEGDLAAAFELATTARSTLTSASAVLGLARLWFLLPTGPGEERIATREPVHLDGHVHTLERDRAAIQYHYDVGNDFYRLFLDQRMIYSCAYFPTGEEDIDAAQEAKLEHICRKLRLAEGERLLDIGCGWGGLLIYAAQRHGIQGVGVTLSREQHRLANERIEAAGLGAKLRVELRDYRELHDESFDKVVSVGMFEHVGRSHFPEYFEHVFRLLRPGGVFLNHAIASRPERSRKLVSHFLDSVLVGNTHFRKRYIFPDGELAPVSAANLQAEVAGFEVRDVENLREHYALTLRHWLRRLRARREEAVQIAGSAMFRLWEMYLAGSIYHFDTGEIGIDQSLLSKSIDGRCLLPRTRADLYREASPGIGAAAPS